MCSSSIISSLLWFSCQPGSPASQRVGAKCLVWALVGHVFLAQNFQICNFPPCKAVRSPFYAVGYCFGSRCLTKGHDIGVQNSSGQGEWQPLWRGLPDASRSVTEWQRTGQLSRISVLYQRTRSARSRLSAMNGKFVTVRRVEAMT